jgi:hypothetical protein
VVVSKSGTAFGGKMNENLLAETKIARNKGRSIKLWAKWRW